MAYSAGAGDSFAFGPDDARADAPSMRELIRQSSFWQRNGSDPFLPWYGYSRSCHCNSIR